MGIMLKERFGSVFAEMSSLSHAAAKIDETKVYEEANLQLRPYMWGLLDEAFNSESGLGNIENFKASINDAIGYNVFGIFDSLGKLGQNGKTTTTPKTNSSVKTAKADDYQLYDF